MAARTDLISVPPRGTCLAVQNINRVTKTSETF